MGWCSAARKKTEEKKKIIFQEVVRLLQGTDILPLFHQLNLSPYLQSPKLVTTSWKQADNPALWSDSSS